MTFPVLERHHAAIRGLVLRTRSFDGLEARQHSRDELVRLLLAHCSIEEEYLYAKLEENEDTVDWAESAFFAHEQLREILEELSSCAPGEPEFEPILDELDELLEEHLLLEEQRVIPWLTDHWPKERLAELADQMAARATELENSDLRPVQSIEPTSFPEA